MTSLIGWSTVERRDGLNTLISKHARWPFTQKPLALMSDLAQSERIAPAFSCSPVIGSRSGIDIHSVTTINVLFFFTTKLNIFKHRVQSRTPLHKKN